MPNPRIPVLFGGKPVISFREETDRRRFLRGAVLVGVGSTLAATTLRDPLLGAQSASMPDLEILNYALTLEYLEADFYAMGLAQPDLLQGRELELVQPIAQHEAAHVQALTQTIQDLGGTPVEKPMFVYPEGTFADRMTFLTTASTFEELGVTAYQGQAPLIENDQILTAAAAIAGVESRHAAILADLTGTTPFPSPIEDAATMEQVLQAVMPFIQGS